MQKVVILATTLQLADMVSSRKMLDNWFFLANVFLDTAGAVPRSLSFVVGCVLLVPPSGGASCYA